MKIAVLNNIIETDNIYQITDIKYDYDRACFDIVLYGNVNITIRANLYEKEINNVCDIPLHFNIFVLLRSNNIYTNVYNNIKIEKTCIDPEHWEQFKLLYKLYTDLEKQLKHKIESIRNFVVEKWNNGSNSIPKIDFKDIETITLLEK